MKIKPYLYPPETNLSSMLVAIASPSPIRTNHHDRHKSEDEPSTEKPIRVNLHLPCVVPPPQHYPLTNAHARNLSLLLFAPFRLWILEDMFLVQLVLWLS